MLSYEEFHMLKFEKGEKIPILFCIDYFDIYYIKKDNKYNN
jgi:hypothetical protein